MKIAFKKGVSAMEIAYFIEKIEDNYNVSTGKTTIYSVLQEYNIKYELYDLWGTPLTDEISSRNIDKKIQEICNCIALPCYFYKEIKTLVNTNMIHSENLRYSIFWFFSYLVGIYNDQTEDFLISEIRKINFKVAFEFLDKWIGLDEIEDYIIYYMKERRKY